MPNEKTPFGKKFFESRSLSADIAPRRRPGVVGSSTGVRRCAGYESEFAIATLFDKIAAGNLLASMWRVNAAAPDRLMLPSKARPHLQELT